MIGNSVIIQLQLKVTLFYFLYNSLSKRSNPTCSQTLKLAIKSLLNKTKLQIYI